MYQLLQGLANTMMIFGATLFILGMIALPFEFSYKKKHGALPKGTRIILYAGLGFASLLITVPLKLFVFKPGRAPHHNANFTYVQPDQAVKDTAIKRAAERMGEQIDGQHGIQRREITPEQRAEQARQDAERERQDAERERERQEARERRAAEAREAQERHAAAMKEAQDRHAAVRRTMEEMREMRKADYFEPPHGSTTPAQEALDEKIIAANKELQELKADKERLEEEAASASEAYRDQIKAGVPDRARLDELRTRSSESRKAAFEAGRGINEKRSEVTRLLDERYDLRE